MCDRRLPTRATVLAGNKRLEVRRRVGAASESERAMSRPSRLPRESVFAGSSQANRADDYAQCSPSLLECVQNLKDVNAELGDGQQLLRNGTFDLKRMSHVLGSQRV